VPVTRTGPLPSFSGWSAKISITANRLAGTQPWQQPGSAIIKKWSVLPAGSTVIGKPESSTGLPQARSARGVPRSRQ